MLKRIGLLMILFLFFLSLNNSFAGECICSCKFQDDNPFGTVCDRFCTTSSDECKVKCGLMGARNSFKENAQRCKPEQPYKTPLASCIGNNPSLTPGFYYQLVAEARNKWCIDLDEGGVSNTGGKIHAVQCKGKAITNQSWRFIKENNGCYQIESKRNSKCLDVKMEEVDNQGGKIQSFNCAGAASQLWDVREGPKGVITLISVVNGKCLDIRSQDLGNDNDAKIQHYHCNGGDQQNWLLTGGR